MIDGNRQNEIKKRSSDRSFGITMGLAFLFIGLLPKYFGQNLRIWAIVISVSFLLLAMAKSRALTPLNKAWFRLGILLHTVTSPIILGIVFFLVFVPLGILKRIIGTDTFYKKYNLDQKSYWIVRNPTGFVADSLKDQF